MNYNVTDKDGLTMAEGRIQRNREEAARIVERIERNQRIERLVMASSNGPIKMATARLQPETNVVDFIHRRNRGLHEPMATRMNYSFKAARWLTAIGLGVVFLYGILIWILR